MDKEYTKREIEALKDKRTEEQKKIDKAEKEINLIDENIMEREKEIRKEEREQIKPAEIRTTLEGFNNQPTRSAITGAISDWETYAEKEVEIVDTEEEWWKNEEDTMVVRIGLEAGDWDEQKIKWGMEALGKAIEADEIETQIIKSGAKWQAIARFWWD